MIASQRPIGFFAVIKISLLPVSGIVATRAIVSVPPPVNIAAAMARGAFCRWLTVYHSTRVTGLTGTLSVSSGQLEIRFYVVIKDRLIPTFLIMATLTVITVTAQMYIPQLVAATALGVVETVSLSSMATTTV